MTKDLFNSFVTIFVSAYLVRTQTPKQFERSIQTCIKQEDRTEQEANSIIRHFRKEIFPLDKETLEWMRSNMRCEDKQYFSKYKEMQKFLKQK